MESSKIVVLSSLVAALAAGVMMLWNTHRQHKNALEIEKIRNIIKQINIAYSRTSNLIYEVQMFLTTERENSTIDPDDRRKYEYDNQSEYILHDPDSYADPNPRDFNDYFDQKFFNNFEEIKWRIIFYLPDLTSKIERLAASMYSINSKRDYLNKNESYGISGFYKDIQMLFKDLNDFKRDLEKSVKKYIAI